MHVRRAPRRVRLTLVTALAVLSSIVPATAAPVAAWGNNLDKFGTHDWILYQAVRAMGGAPEWLDLDLALRATDDPDTVPTTDALYQCAHIYRESGRRGCAPTAIRAYYTMAAAAYQSGAALAAGGDPDGARAAWDRASVHIGTLAHFLGDIAQPFHAAYAARNVITLHHDYEHLAQQYSQDPDAWSQWWPTSPIAASTDVMRTAVRTAAYARQFYPELRRHLLDHPGVLDARAQEITGLVLRRASAAMASVIEAVPAGNAYGQLRISISMRAHQLTRSSYALVRIHVTDATGDPVQGVAFIARIPTPSGGTRSEFWATDADGNAHFGWSVGSYARNVRFTVPVWTRLGITRTTWNQWFIVR